MASHHLSSHSSPGSRYWGRISRCMAGHLVAVGQRWWKSIETHLRIDDDPDVDVDVFVLLVLDKYSKTCGIDVHFMAPEGRLLQLHWLVSFIMNVTLPGTSGKWSDIAPGEAPLCILPGI